MVKSGLSLCVHFTGRVKGQTLGIRISYFLFDSHFECFECNEGADRVPTRAPKKKIEKNVRYSFCANPIKAKIYSKLIFNLPPTGKSLNSHVSLLTLFRGIFRRSSRPGGKQRMQFILCFRCSAHRHFYSVASNGNHTHSSIS